MGWFWNAFSGGRKAAGSRRDKALSVTKQTEAKIHEFDIGTKKTGSLVLEADDIHVIQVQSQIESIGRVIRKARRKFEDDVADLKMKKEGFSAALSSELMSMRDESVYKAILQSVFLQDERTMAPPGDGAQEANVLKHIHIAELSEKLRTMSQHQSSNNMMEVYSASAKIKEKMGEREAKYLSLVMKRDILINEQRALYEKVVAIQERMIAKLEQCAKDQFEEQYNALRSGTNRTADDLKTRSTAQNGRGLPENRSYSSRILGTQTNVKKKSFLHDLAFDEEGIQEDGTDRRPPHPQAEERRSDTQSNIDESGRIAAKIQATDGSSENQEDAANKPTESKSHQGGEKEDAHHSNVLSRQEKGGSVTSRTNSRSAGRFRQPGRRGHTTATSWQRNPSQRNLNTKEEPASSSRPQGSRISPSRVGTRSPVATRTTTTSRAGVVRSTAASRAAASSSAARRAASSTSGARALGGSRRPATTSPRVSRRPQMSSKENGRTPVSPN